MNTSEDQTPNPFESTQNSDCDAASTTPLSNVVPDDAECIQCGYNLRSLKVDAVCPECGVAVERSWQGFLLKLSSVEHLQRLRRGVKMLVWAISIGVLNLVALSVTNQMSEYADVIDPTSGVYLFSMFLMLLMFPACFIVGLVGWWRFTELDPSLSKQNREPSGRIVLRVAVGSWGASVMANFLIPILAAMFLPESMVSTLLLVFLMFMLTAIGSLIIAFYAALSRMQWIGQRLENKDVVKRSKRMKWQGPLVAILLFFLLGPLIVIALFTNILYTIGKDLDAVIESRANQHEGSRQISAAA